MQTEATSFVAEKPKTTSIAALGLFKGSLGKLFPVLIPLVLLTAVLSFFSGFYLGNRNAVNLKDELNQLTALNNPKSEIYANLKGSFNGKIVRIEGNKAYVESHKGGEGVFSVPNPVDINEFKNGKLTNLGTTREKIVLNEQADIKISGYKEGYAIYAVTYFRDPVPKFNIQESSTSPQVKTK